MKNLESGHNFKPRGQKHAVIAGNNCIIIKIKNKNNNLTTNGPHSNVQHETHLTTKNNILQQLSKDKCTKLFHKKHPGVYIAPWTAHFGFRIHNPMNPDSSLWMQYRTSPLSKAQTQILSPGSCVSCRTAICRSCAV